MHKIFIAIFFVITLISFYIFAALNFNNYEKIQEHLLSNISTKIDFKKQAFHPKNIIVQKSIIPKVFFKEINIDDELLLENIEVKISFLSLLLFNPKIESFNIHLASIKTKEKDAFWFNYEDVFQKIITSGLYKKQIHISKLLIDDRNTQVTLSDFKISPSNHGSKITANLMDQKNNIELIYDESKKTIHITTLIQVPDYNKYVISGTYDQENGLSMAKFTTEISNLPSKLAFSLQDLSSIFSKFTSKEIVKISGQLDKTKDKVTFSNISFDSKEITGTGKILLNFVDQNSNFISFNFSNINLSSWSHLSKGQPNILPNISSSYFAVQKINADIKINKLTLNHNNSLSNFEIISAIEGDKFLVKKFSADFDQGGNFKVSGEIKQNAFRSFFEGTMSLTHQDLNEICSILNIPEAKTSNKIPFSMQSFVKLSSVDLLMQNILLKTESTSLFGDVLTKFIGNTPRTRATLNINRLDLDKQDFPFFFLGYQYLKHLSTGMQKDDYLNKFIPLRKWQTTNSLDFKIGNLILLNKILQDVNLSVISSPGQLRVNNLSLKNQDEFIDMHLELKAQDIKPVLNIKINDASISTNFLDMSNILSIRTGILNNIDFNKVKFLFSGYISKLSNPKNNLTMEKIIFSTENDNLLFNVKQLDAEFLNGNLKSVGSFALEPFAINMAYAINDASMAEMHKILPQILFNPTGTTSIRGTMSTSGNDINALIYNLYIDATCASKEIEINNIDLDDLIFKLREHNYLYQNLKNDVDKHLLTGKMTIQNSIYKLTLEKGLISIKDAKFRTLNSAGDAAASLNLYDLGFNALSKLSFYLDDTYSRQSNKLHSIEINAVGSFLSPKKEAVISELEKYFIKKNKSLQNE